MSLNIIGKGTVRGKARKGRGVPIVLTGSATDMSDFHLDPFAAFAAGFPTKIFPRRYMKRKFYPPVPSNPDGSVKYAPYGLRKIETLLMKEFGEENVVVTHPDNLEKFVGPDTKVIGLSSMEPAGTGFVSRTYTSIVGFGGVPIAASEFKEVIENPVLKKYGSKVILGGSGSWQVHKAKLQDEYGIDCIVMGEGERTAPELIRKIMNGEEVPKVVETEKPDPEEIPTIARPAIYGVVEIMRGCGRGCKFCSPTMRARHSFQLEHILKEVELNASSGTRMIVLQTDDLFLYNCKPGFIPNREAIVKLITAVGAIEGVEYIQPAHASLAPVVYDPKMVEEIAPTLVEKGRWTLQDKRCSSVEIGIETGSKRLMEKYMKGKMLPYKPEDWQDVVVKAIGILNDNGIVPLCTLISGLPGENEDDTLATMELLDKLKNARLFYVPLLFTSEADCMLRDARHADLKHLTSLQWDFIASCWKQNIELWVRDENKPKVKLGAMFAYLVYYRWKYGSKALYPIMKMAGMGMPIGRKMDVGCEPGYCQQDDPSSGFGTKPKAKQKAG